MPSSSPKSNDFRSAPVVGHGLPEAIALGEKVVETIDKAKDYFDGTLPPPLEAERDELEKQISAHVDATAAKLRG